MSGASDKARFYQEQSVPELQELERKKIFTKKEITSITKKRAEFEHKINARGTNVSDFARYVEYEMNVETLRRKRIKRLGVKATNHAGQRRIFFILDRATRKFYGDLGLWMQYVTFARKHKSYKKTSEILTRILRLHPMKPELWIYAATYALEEKADMMEARSYMQRGLRFCNKSGRLWLEYGRLELLYILKIIERERVLGLDEANQPKKIKTAKDGNIEDDVVALPAITGEDIDPASRTQNADHDALEKLSASPTLSGAIPIAIFDAAYNRIEAEQFALDFFDMVSEFGQLPCQQMILNHVMEIVRSRSLQSPATLVRFIRQPVIGLSAAAAEFPAALTTALSRIRLALHGLNSAKARSFLNYQLLNWMLIYLKEDLDADLQKVVEITMLKVWTQYQAETELCPEGKASEVAGLLDKLDIIDLRQISVPGMRSWASRLWPLELSSQTDKAILN